MMMKKDEASGLLTDPHDRDRRFRQWVRFNPDGTVAAVHEVADGVTPPLDRAFDVTALAPTDLHPVTIDPALLAEQQARIDEIATHQRALANATLARDTATANIQTAIAEAVAKVTEEQPVK